VLVVDASVLYEVLTDGPLAGQARARLRTEPDQAAPQVIDAEIVGLLHRDALLKGIDSTTSALALADLQDWPGERFSLRPFIDRVWELKDNVRTWDAFYVALAEAMDCPLLTLDARLGRAKGPRCEMDVLAR
jgi:predicted nucleic acid-binding protein